MVEKKPFVGCLFSTVCRASSVINRKQVTEKCIDKMVEKFNVSRATFKIILLRREEAASPEDTVAVLQSRRKGGCGRPRVQAKKIGDTLKKASLTRHRIIPDAAEICEIFLSVF